VRARRRMTGRLLAKESGGGWSLMRVTKSKNSSASFRHCCSLQYPVSVVSERLFLTLSREKESPPSSVKRRGNEITILFHFSFSESSTIEDGYVSFVVAGSSLALSSQETEGARLSKEKETKPS
jgi:hypothetical protein